MSNYTDPATPIPVETTSALATANFMTSVYMWMSLGIFITAVVATLLGLSPMLESFMHAHPKGASNLMIGLLVIQLIAVVGLVLLIDKINTLWAGIIYIGYAALVGVTFSVLFLVYTTDSIAGTFFLTAFSFAGLSAFGYVTKRDLGPIGSFCMIGLFGLIGITLLSFFVPALMQTSVQLAVAVCGVIIFAGLTAYDTQKIKNLNLEHLDKGTVAKRAIFGALTLYLDFINLFLQLLRLFGRRR